MNATFRGPCLTADQLTSFVDAQLDHDGRDAVLGHLATCPRCRGSVEAERQVKQAVVGLAPVTAPPALLARLQAQAATGPAEVTDLAERRAGRSRSRATSLLAGAASVAVFCIGAASFVGAVAPEPDAPRSDLAITTVVPAADRFVAEHAASVGAGFGGPELSTVSTSYLAPVGSRTR